MPSRRRLALTSFCCLVPLLPNGGLAAPPAPQTGFSEAIDVDVVNVDVFVADLGGHPVRGLGRDDFELRVDGKPVAIANFYAGPASEPPAATAAGIATGQAAEERSGRPIARPLTLVLFVDDMNLTPAGRNPILQLLSRSLGERLGPRDRLLIAVWGDRGLKLFAPPAGDRAAVAAALSAIAAFPPHGTTNTNEWVKAWQDIADAESMAEVDEAWVRLDRLRLQREGEAHHMLLELTRIVDGLGGLDGRKAVLYLSGILQVPSGDGAVRDLAEHANAAGVTLYGLGAQDDYAGYVIGTDKIADLIGFSPKEIANARGQSLARTLQEIAGPTGGVAAVDLNRPAFVLDRIREDAAAYYSLGFAAIPEPAAPAPGAPRHHRLEVRVKGRLGLDVRFPATYAARSRDERLAERTRGALLLDAAAREAAPANPLGVRIGFERDELAPYGRRAVTVLVTLPLARLTLSPAAAVAPLAGEDVREGKVEMFLAARDSTGHELRMRRIAFPVRVPRVPRVPDGEAAAREKSVAYRLRLELPPGASVLALGVRDAVGGGESTVAARYVAGALGGPAPSPDRHPE